MKIVCFYGDNPLASWSLSRGIPVVLRRMGHEVIEIPTLGKAKVTRSELLRINKPIPEDIDFILVSGPEYLKVWIKTFYPQWNELKIPKACWYHESEVRLDRTVDYGQIVPMYDFNFMPNAEDAARYGATFLQIGVDDEMFYDGLGKPRTIDCAFIGTMYDKRIQFLETVKPYIGNVQIRIGNSLVQDLDGINLERSVHLLADEYRRIKILVNLPTLSNVLVSKVLEAAASGCLVLTPAPLHNPVGVQYETGEEFSGKIKQYLANPEQLKAKAAKDCAYVRQHCRLEQRLQDILNKVNGKSHTAGQPQLAAV
jgi:hypothetical protein